MTAGASVYLVSPLSSQFRSYRRDDDVHGLVFTQRPWGNPIPGDWITPQLVPQDPVKPDADFATCYLPSILVATQRAAKAVDFPRLELVPVQVGAEDRYLLNSRVSLRRLRRAGGDVVRTPRGAMLAMHRANFYAEDVPGEPSCFWYQDGKVPRFLLCNEGFRARVEAAGLSGLAFRALGEAF